MRRQSFALTALMIVPLLAAAFAGAAPAKVAPLPDPWGLAQWYKSHEIVPMDAAATLADAQDGAVTLRLLGRTYEAAVAPAPWDARIRFGELQPDGSLVYHEPSFPTYAFLGSLAGEPATQVLLSLTEAGVAGHVRTADRAVHFAPVKTLDDRAPAGLSVVYRAEDVVFEDFSHAEIPTPILDPGVAPEPTFGTMAHVPGPDRATTLWVDSQMVGSTGSWSSRVWNGFNTMNANYETMAGFNFWVTDSTIYGCSDTSCDTTWGMTSSDAGTLLGAWGNKVRDSSIASRYENAHLLTGKSISTPDGDARGAAWQPGRYAVTKSPGQSDYMFALVMAHEAGHGFNGDHGNRGTPFPGRATKYDHDHGSNHVHEEQHCHQDLIITCLEWHTHYTDHWHANIYVHHTLMYGGVTHSGNNERLYELSGGGMSGNYFWVRSCNQDAWTAGTKDSGSTSGFGYNCLN